MRTTCLMAMMTLALTGCMNGERDQPQTRGSGSGDITELRQPLGEIECTNVPADALIDEQFTKGLHHRHAPDASYGANRRACSLQFVVEVHNTLGSRFNVIAGWGDHNPQTKEACLAMRGEAALYGLQKVQQQAPPVWFLLGTRKQAGAWTCSGGGHDGGRPPICCSLVVDPAYPDSIPAPTSSNNEALRIAARAFSLPEVPGPSTTPYKAMAGVIRVDE